MGKVHHLLSMTGPHFGTPNNHHTMHKHTHPVPTTTNNPKSTAPPFFAVFCCEQTNDRGGSRDVDTEQ